MSKTDRFPLPALQDFAVSNGVKFVVEPGGPSLTRQEFAVECDINEIMRRYEVTGILPAGAPEGMYVDFTEIPQDLMSTLEMMDKAQAAFMTLPARVRREFENSPHAFVAYASDPNNLDQMREWGLAPPAPAPAAPAGPAGAVAPASPQASPAVAQGAAAPATQSTP